MPTPRPASATALRYLWLLLVTFAAYYLAGRIGLAVPFTSFNVSPVWPAAGLAPVLMYYGGYRLWPAIFAAAFAVNFLTGLPAVTALLIAAGNSSSGALGAWLLRRFVQTESPLQRLREVVPFVVAVPTTGPAWAATVGVTALSLTGADPWSGFASAWAVWWAGDAMGVLLLAPLLLALRPHRVATDGVLSLLLNVIAAGLITLLVFDGGLVNADVLAFLAFPFVIWAALRFGVPGAAATALFIAAVAIWQTAQGDGPFVGYEPAVNVALLQLYLAVTSITGLILGAVMSERVRAEDLLEREQALRRADARAVESESKFRAVAETAAIAIYIHDGKQLLYVNPAIEQITGYIRDDIVKMNMWDIVHPDDRPRMQSYTAARFRGEAAPNHYQFRIITRTGEERCIDFTGSMVQFEGKRCVLATALDVTERKRAEEALRTSERLATAGRMAAAIAHEINNPLEAMTNLMYLIETSPALPPELHPQVLLAQQQLERVAQVARQTLSFYRDPTGPAPLQITELLDSVIEFYQPKIGSSDVQVERRYHPAQAVVGYPGELRQLFANLLVNALDAVGSGGAICVRVGPAVAGVRVLVADNGPGIPRELRTRVFDPFFTTKGHKGTGLGLWVGRGVVEKHGGRLRLRSGFLPGGRGTAFSVFLHA